MKDLGLDPSRHAYDCLVRAVVSQRHFKDGMEIESSVTIIVFKVTYFWFLQTITAFLLLFVWLEFVARDQPERALRVFAKMKQIKLVPDIRIYENLFSLFGTVNAPYENGNRMSQADAFKRINAIERDMAKNGIQHSHISMKINGKLNSYYLFCTLLLGQTTLVPYVVAGDGVGGVGSLDGKNWTNLRVHENDGTVCKPGQFASW
ncbi:hypothetical protein AHAS_Ahas16G0327000 [Arachis hypogaea]